MLRPVVQNMAQNQRKLRRPQHTFQVRHKPWVLQPFMVAPVLAHETLRNLLMQARVVTDPIRHPLVGWWLEHYYFYVKLRDLAGRDDFTEMLLDPSKDVSSYEEAASTPYYHYGGAINWTKLALVRVVEEFFRNEGEAWDSYTIGGMPIASVSRMSWMDSMILSSERTAIDVDVDLNADSTIMASEVETAMQTWSALFAGGMTEMTFEDYLKSCGVRGKLAEEDSHKPELVRMNREWTYPTNTVNPADGSPTSACSWSVVLRADKDRYFTEPGFLIGITCARPKIYFKNQAGSAASMMADAMRWLPHMLANDPNLGYIEFAGETVPAAADAEGPVQVANADYWVDVADLLMHGDQFVNFSMATETDGSLVALPSVALQKRYASQADADGLFVDETPGTAVLVKQDGITTLGVASHQRDTSPTQ